jgi:predicted RNase H-like HicB family nuclease
MITTHVYRDYVFHIHYEALDPCYSVNFPDIPEIITSGESLSEAFANACEALDLFLEMHALSSCYPADRGKNSVNRSRL